MKYTIEEAYGQLMIVGSDGSLLSLALLDKYRLTSDPNQIGRRYWDEKWQCWSYEIRPVKKGTDVSGFIDLTG